MRPVLFSIGDHLEFHAYTVMMAIALVVCTLLAVRENYKLAKPYNITPIAGIWIALAGRVGAHAWWILQYGPAYEEKWGREIHLYESFYIWDAGLVYYGGLVGGLLAAIIYFKVNRVPLLVAGDICMPFLPLGIAITRVGCFLNGCCWGQVTDLPWGIAFPKPSHVFIAHRDEGLLPPGATESLHVHPTQLYSVAGLLIVFAIMRFFYKRPHRTGSILFLYPLLYGVMRFCTEALRGDSPRSVLNMTLSQMVSLGLVAFALAAYAVLAATLWRRNEEQHPPEAGEA